jgi:polyphosphate kinase 2 (PPK2 family)
MSLSIDLNPFIFKGDRSFSIKETPTDIDALYQTKKEYKSILKDKQKEIYDLQNVMYAHNRYAMLLIFQAMDAAGKDGTIKHIMSGVNPHGLQIFSFKKPSTNELDHDFMWRTSRCMPERGRIGIFNRSYYEEVLVVKVHPEILTRFQRIPREFTRDLDTVWQQRYTDIVNFERYIHHQGIQVMKFFLHLSKQEQKKTLPGSHRPPLQKLEVFRSRCKGAGVLE